MTSAAENKNKEFDTEPELPTLMFVNSADGVTVTLAFGYLSTPLEELGSESCMVNEPTVALFHGETLVLIPRGVLEIALQEGWLSKDCPGCEIALQEGWLPKDCPGCEVGS